MNLKKSPLNEGISHEFSERAPCHIICLLSLLLKMVPLNLQLGRVIQIAVQI